MRRNTSKRNIFLRALLLVVLVLIAAAVVFGIAVAVKYNACAKSAERAVIEQTAVLSADQDVPLGKNIQAASKIRLPWGRRLVSFEVSPGKGAQLAGTPGAVRESIGWGSTLWRLNAVMHAYRPGTIEPGTMSVMIEGGAEKKQELSMSLPGFSAKALPVSDKDELVTAGKIAEPEVTGKKGQMVGLIVTALVVIAGILWILLRRRAVRKQAPPPWTVALDTIGHIRSDLHNGKANAASAIVSLTDVIRSYLEVRFRLRVEHQTTREFLDDIRNGGPLDSKQSSFLKEFLNSADMVKFARAPADVMLFDEAATRAETLVRETAVAEPDQGKETQK